MKTLDGWSKNIQPSNRIETDRNMFDENHSARKVILKKYLF